MDNYMGLIFTMLIAALIYSIGDIAKEVKSFNQKIDVLIMEKQGKKICP